MNAKENVRAAIACEPVDYVPLGFYAVDHDTIEKVIGRPTLVRNKVETQIAIWEGRRDDLVESFKNDTVDFYRKIDCADIILFKEAAVVPAKDCPPDPPTKIAPDTWQDRHGRVWKASREANDILCVKDPLARQQAHTVEDFEIPDEFPPVDESTYEAFDSLLAALGREKYICGHVHAFPMPMLGTFDQAMMLYALRPELIHAANRYAVARANFEDQYRSREGMSGAFAEQDMAGSNGPFISPNAWRDMCFPYLKERVADIKQFAGQLSYHCCGLTIPLMEMFIEAGVDCYQSLQTTAGMDMQKLQAMFGGRISFWGGVPVELLIAGEPRDVRKAVRQAVQAGAGRGFILGPSHSIAYGTKYENFMAMLDEYVKLRDNV